MNKDKRPAQEQIEKALLERAEKGELSCAVAFDIVAKLKISPAAVGECLDHLKIKLVKCQLGLFGYQPGKRRVTPASEVMAGLKSAIEAALANGRLPCASAWEIADNLGIAKMDVSNACEALGIKIKPCQLGAF
jgi:hypothetical protein